jgi:hypothetical protein
MSTATERTNRRAADPMSTATERTNRPKADPMSTATNRETRTPTTTTRLVDAGVVVGVDVTWSLTATVVPGVAWSA